MKRLLDALLVLALFPALLWLWWQWSQYEGWITRYEMKAPKCYNEITPVEDLTSDRDTDA